jgi:hypothetical protein
MNVHEGHYKVFTRIKEQLEIVSDAISENSILLRPEQIDALEQWREARWGLLYHDSSNMHPTNSSNLFERELETNRKRLRDGGLDLLDHKEEMYQFVHNYIEPLEVYIIKVLTELELQIDRQKQHEPVEPVRVSESEGSEEDIYIIKYKRYLELKDNWELVRYEALKYESELSGLTYDLNFIRKTVEKQWPRNIIEKNSKTPYGEQQAAVKDKKHSEFDSFEELFIKPEDLLMCVEALRRIDPPLISEDGAWIGRKGSKAKFAAWIKRLEDSNKICFVPDKRNLVPLVNSYFPSLDFGSEARSFADPDKDALDEFTALIPR